MIILIERPTKDGEKEYTAWCADCKFGHVAGTGLSIQEAKNNLENSLVDTLLIFEELKEFDTARSFDEYMQEDRFYYMALQ